MKNSCKEDFVNEVNEITLNCDIFVFKKNCVNHLNSAQCHFKWTIMSTWPQYFYAFSKLVVCGKKNKKNKFNAREEQIIWIKLIVFSREKIIYDRTIHSNHYLCTCRQKLDFFYANKEIYSEAGHNWERVQWAVFWSNEPRIYSTLRIASARGQNCHAIYQFYTLLLWF